MVTARHSTPASEWTRAIDAALADWSRFLVGDQILNIENKYIDNPDRLAAAGSPPVYVGKQNGNSLYITQPAAVMQGYEGVDPDISISINPIWDWSFSGNPSSTEYDANSVMTHELGHGLFARPLGFGDTPFELWADDHPHDVDGSHTTDPESLMYAHGHRGEAHGVAEGDARMAGQSGLPTIFDDRIYLLNGANVDAGSGNDTGIWLDTFDNYNANLTNFENLEFNGDNALTDHQSDIYKLYQAGLNRAPDLEGFNYWNSSGKDFQEMANNFVGAPEFAQSAGIEGRGDYISALYQNILGREPDQGGLDYWNGREDLDRGGLLANIALAPENEISSTAFTL